MNIEQKERFEERQKRSLALMKRYRDRVPVIIKESKVKFEKTKFLPWKDSTFGQFMHFSRKYAEVICEKETLIGFIDNVMVPVSADMGSLYGEHADPDGFLYVTITRENTFG
jgi:hypothetical protein